jgi:CTP-dependent riboflavin kinase
VVSEISKGDLMTETWILRGTVRSGAGRGAFFTQLGWVQEQCRAKLGFSPYAGTLNIEVDSGDVPLVEEIQREAGIELIPPDPEFCKGRTLHAELVGLPGALIIPEESVRIHGSNVIEIMAGMGLKETLNLKDGDPVTILVKKAFS